MAKVSNTILYCGSDVKIYSRDLYIFIVDYSFFSPANDRTNWMEMFKHKSLIQKCCHGYCSRWSFAVIVVDV